MAFPAPRVVLEAVRQDEAERRIRQRSRARRAHDVAMAKDFALVDATHHHAYRGCSGIEQYGETLGFSGREARTLARAGRAFGLCSALEQRVAGSHVSLDAAAALEPLLVKPSLVRAGEDWLSRAERWPCRRLEREVRRRVREAADGEPVAPMTILLTGSARDLLARARVIASRKAGHALDAGQTVGVIADHYLDSFDATRRKPRARRMPSTATVPGETVPGETGPGETLPGRHVPAAVQRLVANRQNGTCCVPGCEHEIFLEYAHLIPHRDGGSREACNLVYPCHRHHTLADHGLLSIGGTADHPVFRDADGNVIGEDSVGEDSVGERVAGEDPVGEDSVGAEEARAPPEPS